VNDDKNRRWFAMYLVTERVSLEHPKHQEKYLELLDLMDDEELMRSVIHVTYNAVNALRKVKNWYNLRKSQKHRSELENLGVWLGKLTLARGQPLDEGLFNLEDVLVHGFENNLLLAVMPFACKIMEAAKKSEHFKLPHPWTSKIIGLLAEISGPSYFIRGPSYSTVPELLNPNLHGETDTVPQVSQAPPPQQTAPMPCTV